MEEEDGCSRLVSVAFQMRVQFCRATEQAMHFAFDHIENTPEDRQHGRGEDRQHWVCSSDVESVSDAINISRSVKKQPSI